MIELPKRFVSKTVAANQHVPGREGYIRLTLDPGKPENCTAIVVC